MNALKSFVSAIVLFSGLSLFQNVYSNKTEEQLVSEIKSVADSIEEECTYETVKAWCDIAKEEVNASDTIHSVCSALHIYLACQDNNCVSKSTALTHIFKDAFVNPHCKGLNLFPLTPKASSVANQVTEMVKLCNFDPGKNCDMAHTGLMRSTYIAEICVNQVIVMNCLEVNCTLPSNDLKQKITEAKMDIICGIHVLAWRLHFHCKNELLLDACFLTKLALDTDETLSTMCKELQIYTVCKKLNCFEKSTALEGILTSYTSIVHVCSGVVNMSLEPVVEKVISEISYIAETCRFESTKQCFFKMGSFSLTSVKREDICRARTYYADCFNIICVSPSRKLKEEIHKAKDKLSCESSSPASSGVVVVSVVAITYLWFSLRTRPHTHLL